MQTNEIATKDDIIELRNWLDTKIQAMQKSPKGTTPYNKELLTSKQVCELLMISQSTLCRHIRSGSIFRLEVSPNVFRFPSSQFQLTVTNYLK